MYSALSERAYHSLSYFAYTDNKTIKHPENTVKSKEMPVQDSNISVENLHVHNRQLTVMVLLNYKNLQTYLII